MRVQTLKSLVRKIKEYDGKILFNNDDIYILNEEKGLYTDARTNYDINENLHNVYMIGYECRYYYYVCPSCNQIHSIHKDDIYRKVSPGCANMRCGRKGNVLAVINDKGEIVKLPLCKIKLHKEWKGLS